MSFLEVTDKYTIFCYTLEEIESICWMKSFQECKDLARNVKIKCLMNHHRLKIIIPENLDPFESCPIGWLQIADYVIVGNKFWKNREGVE